MARGEFWTRRDVFHAGLAAALAIPARLTAAAPDVTSLDLIVKETAGLRRFSYPVHTLVPAITLERGLRLLRDGRVVPAQFRPVMGPDGRPAIALDFTSSVGPLESEHYVVESGMGPEPKNGIEVEHPDATFRVSHGTSLNYTVGDQLPGFLESVSNARREFVAAQSGGLFLRSRNEALDGDRATKLGGLRGTITRQGPLAAGLRFEGTAPLAGAPPVTTTVDMTFPSSKSWVETTWRVDDPMGSVAGLRVELQLKLDGEPALVDLGTAATIYGVLRGRERMTLTAGFAPWPHAADRPWIVHKGPSEKMTVFAEAPRPDSPRAEGWAHVMDSSRCTALAVAGFGRETRDRIELETDGRVRIEREFAGAGSAPPPGPKVVTFWFHFVPMPVQIGAATSPQAMLAPLAIDWGDSRP